MAYNREIDLNDGGDERISFYDERKEKRYHATVWLAIATVLGLVLVLGIYHHVRELDLLLHGNYVEAEYHSGSFQASYTDETGRKYYVNVTGFSIAPEDGESIRLYYKEDIKKAEPMSAAWFWAFVYVFFGGGIAFCIFRIWRIYHPKRHLKE